MVRIGVPVRLYSKFLDWFYYHRHNLKFRIKYGQRTEICAPTNRYGIPTANRVGIADR